MRRHGLSVKGPDKEENQDAVGVIDHKDYLLMVVADGLGSVSDSAFGSATAIKAVKRAVVEFRKLESSKSDFLVQLITFYWRLFVQDMDKELSECGSTCLFAYLNKQEKRMVTGQLGDGLIFLKSRSDIQVTPTSSSDFNLTKNLSSARKKDWLVREMEITQEGFDLILLTDGISEDIQESKVPDFLEVLKQELTDKNPQASYWYLKKLLSNWPTKYHRDDKSICIAWEKS